VGLGYFFGSLYFNLWLGPHPAHGLDRSLSNSRGEVVGSVQGVSRAGPRTGAGQANWKKYPHERI